MPCSRVTEPAVADDDRRVLHIRKYPNRRYYDSTRSRHLTLEEIHAAIRDGYEVEVIDSKSSEDITAKVLAQIILELDPPKLSAFPVPLLHGLLRSNEQLVRDFTEKYFSRALQAFLASQRQFEQYMRQALGLPSTAPTAADWAKVMWGPLNPSLWANGGGGAAGEVTTRAEGGPAGRPAGSPPGPELAATVAELRRQVSDLKKELTAARRPGRSSRPATSRASSRRAGGKARRGDK